MKKRNLIVGDLLVVLPFAWLLSQALLELNFWWFFGALWTFDIYAYLRRNWHVR